MWGSDLPNTMKLAEEERARQVILELNTRLSASWIHEWLRHIQGVSINIGINRRLENRLRFLKVVKWQNVYQNKNCMSWVFQNLLWIIKITEDIKHLNDFVFFIINLYLGRFIKISVNFCIVNHNLEFPRLEDLIINYLNWDINKIMFM